MFNCVIFFIFLGEIHGQTKLRVGMHYSAVDQRHYQTDINTLCASLYIDGTVTCLEIKCSTRIVGQYISITVQSAQDDQIVLCDVIVA